MGNLLLDFTYIMINLHVPPFFKFDVIGFTTKGNVYFCQKKSR